MSNMPPYPQEGVQPQMQPQAASSNKNGLIIGCLIAAGVAIPVLLICGGVLVALLLPAVSASREAARRMQCSNNMKQIGLAFHNYHDVYRTFPPAYTVDEDGNRLHSWRSLILPFMEQQALHAQIDFSKPWDDPANRTVAQTAIPAYHCPSSPGDPLSSSYVAIVDPQGIMSGENGSQMQSVTDGISNTILLTEVDTSQAVPWMSPEDIDLATYLAVTASSQHNHPGGSNTLLADGSVRFVASEIDEETLKGMVTKDNGERAGF
ncbi:hypothetical protein FF011L_52250 [Roseimaritima multifibrata]|uniref:DUF1559 domain-containing protein n=1 Tax=Roseimaritima multifibrata TaxID=1930274 RepID=A0A517MNF8_9BACT|nr:DUF1559 domain-containing protein [Roseimaritima multifibrata]QDS96415.1 hypothetical protein FF011L_52250 [Roseimaritima multifibrata]